MFRLRSASGFCPYSTYKNDEISAQFLRRLVYKIQGFTILTHILSYVSFSESGDTSTLITGPNFSSTSSCVIFEASTCEREKNITV